MDWMAKSEQREGAMFRVFFMLVASFLLTIRSAMESGRVPAYLQFEADPRPDASAIENQSSPAQIEHAVFGLLAAIYAAAQQLKAMLYRAVYEFMNQSDTLARSLIGDIHNPADQCALPRKRLDSS